MLAKPAMLVLADGEIYRGKAIGANGFGVGELVFNTSMIGYQEILTDPSYASQIITFTTAHIGNTGCNTEDIESSTVWAKGIVVRDCALHPSNYRASISLPSFLKKNNIVGISGIDTRALTKKLRDKGSISACVTTEVDAVAKCINLIKNFSGLDGKDLAKVVSRQVTENWYEGRGDWCSTKSRPLQYHVVVYDFGVKHNILRILHDIGCYITIVPATTSVDTVLNMKPDGIVLSNGPGDPKACDYAISAVQQFIRHKIPLFGICLGFQILALACGAKSYKMKFGHHGANHPVVSLDETKRVFITSQNHGFAIDELTLPSVLRATHRSLFDGSLQGIMHTELPLLGFQGHPEASPGPHDVEIIFNGFINLMMEYKYSE